MMRRLLAILGVLLRAFVVAAATAWGALALSYLGPGPATVRTASAWVFTAIGAVTVTALIPRRTRRAGWIGFAIAFALVLAAWARTSPSNDRDWPEDVARLPYATIDGDRLTVHNVRNFEYRTETDFTPAWEDRTYDLRRLDRVDVVASYWGSPAIAHLFLSFGFGDEHLAISIETRKEKGESYSTLAGFFRQYELYAVVADERDVIRLRTNVRKDPPEDVYLFRIVAPIENGRKVFLEYLRDLNELRERPRFYNTSTTNCTTTILAHSRVSPDHPPLSWKVLLSGYAPEYLHEIGRLESVPFDELRRRGHVNAAARAADGAADFSRRIREGVP